MSLQTIFNQITELNKESLILITFPITALAIEILYVFLVYILRPIFRELEQDIAFVTLGVSVYPVLIIFTILIFKFIIKNLVHIKIIPVIEHLLTATTIVVTSYWFVQLFINVFIYYLEEYTKQTEVMWDDVLLPILKAVLPVIVYTISTVFMLKSFGVDLTGIWVALGGATFVLGFALQDILANFFSGIVLLIDTPFQFGDILLLEDGSVGMLRQIGIRVTQLYIFSRHCDVYIPNSVLQGQKITNLSRPSSVYYHSISIEIPAECAVDESKKLIEEIVLAHPDTLGNIETKLELIDEYYDSSDPHLIQQKEIGKKRILAEQEIYLKLEEIGQSLDALVATMQFAEKGGLTQDELENVQQEYREVLELMGFEISEETNNNRTIFNFQENHQEGLIELIRQWYRIWLQEPNLLAEDQNFIVEEWERKINLLTRRVQRLSQKISNPKAEETRLDDYVLDLIKWISDKLKVPRKKWQEPQVRMVQMNKNEDSSYGIGLDITFFVDDIKLEEGKRGDRVKSQIYQEIFRHFKTTYLDTMNK